ncbi:MAG: AI-2E family transporter [Dermabacter sp.]|nr:AI-2E family transporter [Dermabacter sp.]
MHPPRLARYRDVLAPPTDAAEEALPKEVREIPMGLRRGAAWSWRLIVVIAAISLVVMGLSNVSTLVIAVLVALLIASMLSPVVKLLTNHTFLPRGAAAAVTLLGLIVLVVGMFVLAGRQLVDRWEEIYKAALSGFSQLWNDVTGTLDINLDTWSNLQAEAIDQLQKNTSTLISGASSAASTVGNIGTGTAVALFTLFFLLTSGSNVWRWFLGFVPAHARTTTHEAFRRGWKALSAYCRTQILVAAVDATGIALGMVGIDIVSDLIGREAPSLSGYAVPIWLIVFLFSFIPLVGAIVSGAIATLLVFVLQGWIPALVMLGIVLLVQQLESNILQPILMGKAVELHPLAVFLGVTAGAVVAGIPGALFAIPMLAFGNALLSYLDGRDPAPELGIDEKTRAYFIQRDKRREEFFARQPK